MTTTRLYLIRHGKPASTWGEADDDPGLDDQGQAQAEAVADRLMPPCRPENGRSTVVSSPLRRCRETAQPLADLLGVAGRDRSGRRRDPDARGARRRGAPGLAATVLRRGLGARSRATSTTTPGAVGAADSLAARGGAAVFSHFVAINAVVSGAGRAPTR